MANECDTEGKTQKKIGRGKATDRKSEGKIQRRKRPRERDRGKESEGKRNRERDKDKVSLKSTGPFFILVKLMNSGVKYINNDYSR
jgi:hypothetical protein